MAWRCKQGVSSCNRKRDARHYLFVFHAVFENVLDYQAPRFSQGNLMPHTTQRFVDFQHNLRRLIAPAEFEEFLPDMAGVAMNNGLWDATKQLMDHHSLLFLRNTIKSLLNHMAAKRIHAET